MKITKTFIFGHATVCILTIVLSYIFSLDFREPRHKLVIALVTVIFIGAYLMAAYRNWMVRK